MKLNKKGFMASAVLYVLLGLFLSLMISVVLMYSNRKVMMDKMQNMVNDKLESNESTDNRTGDREEYFKAARAYMKTNSKYNSFTEENDVSLIDVNSLINEGLLPKDIVSPLTNRKEITQNNYVVAVVNGDDYTFSYVDNATAKDYISVVNNLEKRVTALEDTAGTSTTLLNRTYPIGSVYISTTLTTPTQVQTSIGGVWEVYGSGRSLVGVNTSDANFNTVNKTGGSTTTTLSVANLPAHTHSIPALSGTAASAGAHTHTRGTMNITGSFTTRDIDNTDSNLVLFASGSMSVSRTVWAGAHDAAARAQKNSYYYNNVNFNAASSWSGSTSSDGAHTHSIATNASTSGSTGSTAAFSNLGPYITVYMYKRTA